MDVSAQLPWHELFENATKSLEGYTALETHMNLEEFKTSITEKQPPSSLSVPLTALWWDAKENWARAHALVDQMETTDGMAVHA